MWHIETLFALLPMFPVCSNKYSTELPWWQHQFLCCCQFNKNSYQPQTKILEGIWFEPKQADSFSVFLLTDQLKPTEDPFNCATVESRTMMQHYVFCHLSFSLEFHTNLARKCRVTITKAGGNKLENIEIWCNQSYLLQPFDWSDQFSAILGQSN